MATNKIEVKIVERVTKGQVRVDILPVNPNENMNTFFRQFAGKTITIVAEPHDLSCGNMICARFGKCQGHWTEDELKAESDKPKTDGENK